MKKGGFTLAEVLITLGIIGVVVAMTIPTLMTNIKAAKLKSQFLKAHSTVQQAYKMMEADGQPTEPSYYDRSSSGTEFVTVFRKYFTGVTACTYNKQKYPCFYDRESPYKSLDGKIKASSPFLTMDNLH